MTSGGTPAAAPRRILMTGDCVGGVWGYALELARTLAPLGTHVHLATMGRLPSDAQRAEASRIPGLTLHAAAWRLEWMEEPWDDVARAGEWLLALERSLRPDVVHLNGYAHAALPFAAPTLVVAHSCVRSWWRAVHRTEAPPAWDRYREAVAEGLRHARMVAAPTRAMLDALRAHYGVSGEQRVIPNARDVAHFRPQRKDAFVLSAGRVWDEGKNVAAVARAAERCRWPVFIAGDDVPPEGAGGIPQARRGAQYLGRLSEVQLAGWMGRAGVCVLPARYEPFGLVALEAALSGCALVLGDIPSLREVWGNAPLWVDPNDDAAILLAIRALIDDPDLRELVAARCRVAALQYTPERMRDGYLAAYASLTGRSHAGAATTTAPAALPSADGGASTCVS